MNNTPRLPPQTQIHALLRLVVLGTSLASKNDASLVALARRGLVERHNFRWRMTPTGEALARQYQATDTGGNHDSL